MSRNPQIHHIDASILDFFNHTALVVASTTHNMKEIATASPFHRSAYFLFTQQQRLKKSFKVCANKKSWQALSPLKKKKAHKKQKGAFSIKVIQTLVVHYLYKSREREVKVAWKRRPKIYSPSYCFAHLLLAKYIVNLLCVLFSPNLRLSTFIALWEIIMVALVVEEDKNYIVQPAVSLARTYCTRRASGESPSQWNY